MRLARANELPTSGVLVGQIGVVQPPYVHAVVTTLTEPPRRFESKT